MAFDQDAFACEFGTLVDAKLKHIRVNKDAAALVQYIPVDDTVLLKQVNLSQSNFGKQANTAAMI